MASSSSNAGLRDNEVVTSTAINLVDGNQLFLVRPGMGGGWGGGEGGAAPLLALTRLLLRHALLLPPPLQALKTKGPLAITIWADGNPGFQLYRSGIYTNAYPTESE